MMKIKRKVLEEIRSTIGTQEPETGGILGINDGVVCAFYFDKNAEHRIGEYSPNTSDVNLKLAEWAKQGIAFAGIIHSHPNGLSELSEGDREGIFTVLKAIPKVDKLYFPIVTNDDSYFSMSVYCAIALQDDISITQISYEVLD